MGRKAKAADSGGALAFMAERGPTIDALVPWFGAKRTLAPRIVAALGPHRAYWELFCGSMAVLLAKPQSRLEVVNDLNGDLINLARVIRDPALGPAFYRTLRRVLFAEEEYLAAEARIRSEPPPPPGAAPDPGRAFAYFIMSWQGRNGFGGTESEGGGLARRFTSTGGSPGRRWSGAVDSIPAWRRRLAPAEVLRSCGIGLARKVEDRDGTVIYADPPYVVKGAEYLHDFRPEDHRALAGALGRFRETRVVLSYYAHPLLAELYPGWHLARLDVAKGLASPNRGSGGGAGDAAKAPEVLLSNLPWPEGFDPGAGLAADLAGAIPA